MELPKPDKADVIVEIAKHNIEIHQKSIKKDCYLLKVFLEDEYVSEFGSDDAKETLERIQYTISLIKNCRRRIDLIEKLGK